MVQIGWPTAVKTSRLGQETLDGSASYPEAALT